MESDFRWLHFSDLHFGHYNNKIDIMDLREKLVRCISSMNEKFCDIKYVFITGDVADKGQYSSVTKKLMGLLMDSFENLGIQREHVFWCCGNHDFGRTIKGTIFPSGVRSGLVNYEQAMNDSQVRKENTEDKFKEYLEKHKEYIGRAVNPNLQDVSQAHFFYALDDLNLIVLNTCITSCDDCDERQLYIMEGKLYEVFKNIDPEKPTFVIGHHGIEFFNQNDQKALGELFDDSKVDYYLCGHSHKLSCRVIPDLSADIREFTAGGMMVDHYAQTVFYLGHYSVARHGVHLTPYVYTNSGNFKPDFEFSRAFPKNRWYQIERFKDCSEKVDTEPVSFAAAREEAKKYYDVLRNEHGRLAGIHVDEGIIPNAVRYFDTFVGTEDDEKIKLTDIVEKELKDVKGIALIGEGGSGKTTALLRIWEDELKRGEYVPVYMPLNEYNSFKSLDNFIELYLNDRYHINIKNAPYKILMLLDGFNEITEQQDKAVKEIKTLLIQYGTKLKIMITSRREQELSSLLTVMSHYILLPLDEKAVVDYLNKAGVPVEEKILPVLITPMMLTLYTSNCFIQDEIKRKLSLQFMTADSKAAIIYNYLLCQLGKLFLDGQNTELLSAYSYLFFVAPYVAYFMEESGRYNIETDSLLSFDKECKAVFTKEVILKAALNVLGDMAEHGQREVSVYEMLVFRQHMLMEEERKYFFRHQHFRDFLSAWNIVNYIRKDNESGINLLMKRRLPETILEMIAGMNTIIGAEEWECVLAKLYGRRYKETGYAVNNLIAILEGFQKKKGLRELNSGNGITNRYYPPVAEKLCGLDFELVSLYGRNFSGYKPAVFSKCLFSKNNFISSGHHSSVTCVEYGVDGNGDRIALTASLDGSIKEWNLRSGECVNTCFAGADLTSAAYIKNQEFILAASTDHTVYRFVSHINGRGTNDIFKYTGHKGSVKCIDVCSDGKYFITASEDGIIREWDHELKEVAKEFAGSKAAVRSVRYSRDNKYIVSGAQNGEIRIWVRELGYTIFQFRAHKKAVTDIRISPDGTCFLTASADNLIREWKFVFSEDDAIQGVEEKPAREFRGHSGVVTSVHYNHLGDKILTTSNDSKVMLWDYDSKKVLKKYTGHSNRVNWAVFSPDEDKILSAAHNGEVFETDMESGEVLSAIHGVDDRNNCMIKMSDRFVITGTSDGMLKEWDVINRKCVRTFPGHQGAVKCIANYDHILYSCGEDRKLYRWSYKDGVIEKIVCLPAAPRSMDLSEDGERILLGLGNCKIVELDTLDLRILKIYGEAVKLKYAEGLKYIHGHEKFVSITKDRTLRLWHSGVDACEMIYGCAGNQHLTAVGYGHKRNCIYIAEGRDILELDADTYEEKHRYEGHLGTVRFLEIDSARGTMLAGISDGTVQEWNLENYTRIKNCIGHQGAVSGAVHCADQVISSSFDGTIRVWDKNGVEQWRSMPFGRINIAGSRFRDCIFADEEVQELILENGGSIES